MEKIEFNVDINAPREKVWNVLLGEQTYPQWTAVFSEGSRVETDWKKGSKALFLDGKGDGMVSFIEEHIPNEFMSIKHMGMIMNGVEDYDSEETKSWAGALENYHVQSVDGHTELHVEIDMNKDFKDYFEKTWPEALQKVKSLSENSTIH